MGIGAASILKHMKIHKYFYLRKDAMEAVKKMNQRGGK